MLNLTEKIVSRKSMIVFLFCFLFIIFTNTIYSQSNTPNPNPKENTFFPVTPGSFWKYVERDAIYPDEVNMQTDSVISVKDTIDGFVVKELHRLGTGKKYTYYYLVSNDGSIYSESDNKWYLYAKLNPKIGDKIPDADDTSVVREYKKIYGGLPSINNDCLCLEPYSLEISDSEKRNSWFGYVFCRGVGIIFRGGIEDGLDLIEYRIGKNGKVTNLPRPVPKNK